MKDEWEEIHRTTQFRFRLGLVIAVAIAVLGIIWITI